MYSHAFLSFFSTVRKFLDHPMGVWWIHRDNTRLTEIMMLADRAVIPNSCHVRSLDNIHHSLNSFTSSYLWSDFRSWNEPWRVRYVSDETFHLGEGKRVVTVTFILLNIITDDDPFVLFDALWPNSILRARITRPSCIFSHHNRMSSLRTEQQTSPRSIDTHIFENSPTVIYTSVSIVFGMRLYISFDLESSSVPEEW